MKLFTVILAIFLITGTLYSQSNKQHLVSNYITLGVGITIPTGDFSKIGKTGYNIFLNYTDIMSDFTALRSTLSYHFIPFNKAPTDQTYKVFTLKGDIIFGMFSSKSQLKPYGYAGLGYYDLATSESNTGYIGFDIGVGAMYAISPKFVMYAETDYNITFSKDNPINHLPLKVGFMFGI